MEQSLVDGFPVDSMDPPHSDVIIPAHRNVEADMWQMEYAFRKVCYRAKKKGTARRQNAVEHYVLPKNLIAYFVQRIMQFKPETFGRFRIRDGSHTHITIDEEGEPMVKTVGETNHWLKEHYRQNLQGDGDNGIGLDVPVESCQNNNQDGVGDCSEDAVDDDELFDCVEDSVDDDCDVSTTAV